VKSGFVCLTAVIDHRHHVETKCLDCRDGAPQESVD